MSLSPFSVNQNAVLSPVNPAPMKTSAQMGYKVSNGRAKFFRFEDLANARLEATLSPFCTDTSIIKEFFYRLDG